jgi:hypothetical protein
MKRSLLVVFAVLLIAAGIFTILYVFNSLKPVQKGALQVTSNIKGTVALNGKAKGVTPVCLCPENNDTIASGQYEITVTPDDKSFSPFVTKVNVEPGVLTVVDRTFLPGSLASSSVITLEKTNTSEPQLFVNTLPQGAMVLVDGNPVGVTPFSSQKITASEHEVQIQRQGFAKKTLRIRTVASYKLIINATLGTSSDSGDTTQTPEISSTPTPTPTPSTPAETVTILQTPTGFLRVRSEASLSGDEIGRVKPGETYPLISEQDGWFQIQLSDGKTTGWVSGDYAQKSSQ